MAGPGDERREGEEMTGMEMKVELQPWMTPNYVLGKMPPRPRSEGYTDFPKWPLSEIDALILSKMCDDFRAEIFKKAGKADPAK